MNPVIPILLGGSLIAALAYGKNAKASSGAMPQPDDPSAGTVRVHIVFTPPVPAALRFKIAKDMAGNANAVVGFDGTNLFFNAGRRAAEARIKVGQKLKAGDFSAEVVSIE